LGEPEYRNAGSIDQEAYRNAIDVDSRAWYWQVAVLLGAPVAFAALGSGASDVVGFGLFGLYLVGYVVALLSFIGERYALKEAGSEWLPNHYLYIVGYIVLTPYVACPLYLYRRYRWVGLR